MQKSEENLRAADEILSTLSKYNRTTRDAKKIFESVLNHIVRYTPAQYTEGTVLRWGSTINPEDIIPKAAPASAKD